MPAKTASTIGTVALIGLGAYTLYRLRFFNKDFPLWNIGKSVTEGAQTAYNEVKKAIPPDVQNNWLKIITPPPFSTGFLIEEAIKQTQQKQEAEKIRDRTPQDAIEATKISNVPSSTPDVLRYINEQTNAPISSTADFLDVRNNLLSTGISRDEANHLARMKLNL